MEIQVRYIVGIISAIVFFIVIGEIFAKYFLGLGTPPLTVVHSTIEYMYKPNQDVYRFNNHFIVNQYGMRSVAFEPKKADDELRIMGFGDSVINGGNLTDHSKLATSLLKDKLIKIAGKNAIVENISAGSWGPGNWLAYAQEYGFFDADIIVLVISSHDYADNPTFQPLNKNTHPTEKPISALFEGFERYLPRYLPLIPGSTNVAETDQFVLEENEKTIQKGLEDLTSFLKLAKSNSSNVLVFQHYEQAEIASRNTRQGNQPEGVTTELGS
ncbi:MAG: hypothetical protein KME01_00200 [Chroococcus sp. CMT-3BRIN-NPC107]|jgi:hypothetical protein|nr:hypothetical protein [Chroococcus sp. CMT-3BRIN-NPC107]